MKTFSMLKPSINKKYVYFTITKPIQLSTMTRVWYPVSRLQNYFCFLSENKKGLRKHEHFHLFHAKLRVYHSTLLGNIYLWPVQSWFRKQIFLSSF
jgi:hypothetical protein